MPRGCRRTLFTFLLVIQLFVSIALIGVVLLQKSKGEGLGSIGGGAQLFFDKSKGLDKALERTTTILAIVFLLLSVVLAIMI